MWSESSNLQTTITSTSRVLTGMTRWLAPSLACEKSMKWTKKWLSISLKKGPCMLTFYKQGSRKPLLRFKLDCINVLLTATATEPSALTPPDHFSGRQFRELIPQHRASSIHRRDVLCAPKQKKKANTTVGIVHTSQDFVPHLTSKFTILSETEHWKWTLFFSCTLS